MPTSQRARTPVFVLVLAVGLALLAHAQLHLALSVAVVLLLVGLGWTFFEQLPIAWGIAMGVLLLGYATMGRGLAHLGVGPVYVGELVLAGGVLVALVHGRAREVIRQPLAWLLIILMAWGAARTLPYFTTYGLDALRDAVLWGYGAFALIVANLLHSPRHLKGIVAAYRRMVPIILVAAPAGYLLIGPDTALIPNAPGSDVALISPKGGDVGVHLVGILAFMALGVGSAWRNAHIADPAHRTDTQSIARKLSTVRFAAGTWFLWILWVFAWGATFRQRAAVVTVLAGIALLVLLRPKSGWWRPTYIAALVLLVAATIDLSVDLGGARELSVESLQIAVVSLYDTVGAGNYDGPRQWRLQWWQDIVDYAAVGPYRWTGKGYGINLATADGYQVFYDDSLRSPHNAHLNVLARSGLPGLVTWAAFHLSLLIALLVASFSRRREGHEAWAALNQWLFIYLVAFHINGSFDVYLEGPQGGIWFWTVVGVAMATLLMQGRGDTARTPV